MLSDRKRYRSQKAMAKVRGIEWKLTFAEWLAWWKGTGHFHERGCKRGQYVMARRGDAGAYALNNIMCIPNAENNLKAFGPVRKGVNHGRTKLTLEQVMFIKTRPTTSVELARQFNVSPSCVKQIWRGVNWKNA